MNVLVDTNFWIDFLKGKIRGNLVEDALQDGRVYITPLVFSELLSGAISNKEEKQVLSLLMSLNITEPTLEHWQNVGLLRRRLRAKGFSVSIPDAHLMQTCFDVRSILVSRDKIFKKTKHLTKIDLFSS